MQKIRMAAVGCGQAGYGHLETFMAQPEVSLTVAVDIDEKRLEEISKKHNIETSTDYRDVIKDEGIDAVIIASSNETHPGIAIEAMKAGKHVFCEKPIAPTLEECRKVVSIARKHQRIFHTHFELRHSVVPVRIKEIIDSGQALISLLLFKVKDPWTRSVLPLKTSQVISRYTPVPGHLQHLRPGTGKPRA